MKVADISEEEVEQVRIALRIAVPLEQASPLIQRTLAMIAHCWGGKVPANLWADEERARQAKRVRVVSTRPVIDVKRRAAGDTESI